MQDPYSHPPFSLHSIFIAINNLHSLHNQHGARGEWVREDLVHQVRMYPQIPLPLTRLTTVSSSYHNDLATLTFSSLSFSLACCSQPWRLVSHPGFLPGYGATKLLTWACLQAKSSAWPAYRSLLVPPPRPCSGTEPSWQSPCSWGGASVSSACPVNGGGKEDTKVSREAQTSFKGQLNSIFIKP